MFRFVVVVACAATVAWGAPAAGGQRRLASYTFEQYVADHAKEYSQDEEPLRRDLFKLRLAEAMEHNAQGLGWTKTINHMSDRTESELASLRGYRAAEGAASPGADAAVARPHTPKELGLPEAVDWRDHRPSVMTAVKNQAHCGSCWTFSAAEAIESHTALATGHLESLSQQQILDCTANPKKCGGSGGCDGGTAQLAFDSIKEMGGITSEYLYPYRSAFGDNFGCSYDSEKMPSAAEVHGYTQLGVNSHDDLLQAVAEKGPISVSVDASTWHSYDSGIYDGCNQTTPDINHAVLLAGYGTENGQDYWIVRNSWSTSWGEFGYIRLARYSQPSQSDRCGMDITPQHGSACEGEDDPVKVCGTCGIWFNNAYPHVTAAKH